MNTVTQQQPPAMSDPIAAASNPAAVRAKFENEREKQAKAEADALAALAPEERAHREKIDVLNRRVREELGRDDLILAYGAEADAISRAEHYLFINQVQLEVPAGTPDRQHAIDAVVRRRALEGNAPGFIARIFRSAAQKQSDAVVAKAQADREVARVLDLHRRWEELNASISELQRELSRARDRHDAMLARYAEMNDDSNLASRYVAMCSPGGGSQDPSHVAQRIDAGRTELAAVIADWPRVEKVLLSRIADLQQQLSKLEAEIGERV